MAGGHGTRMNSALPKQFAEIHGKPMVWYSMNAFMEYDTNVQMIIVLPDDYLSLWKVIINNYNIDFQHNVITGGRERFHSVKNALEVIPAVEGLVAIHDAARPLTSSALIRRCFTEASVYGSAIPAVSIKESIRVQEGNNWKSINRDQYKIIQTPQVFNIEKLKFAYECDYKGEYTDDATVYEQAGNEIHLTEGEDDNFKITNFTDMRMAELLLGD